MIIICAYLPNSLGGPSLCDIVESQLIFLLITKFETLKFIKYFHIKPKTLYKREECPATINKVYLLNKILIYKLFNLGMDMYALDCWF